MAPKRSARSLRLLEWLVVILLGGLVGSTIAGLARALLGDGPVVGSLTRTWTVGLTPPATLDLRVLTLTLGATVEVGLLTALGLFRVGRLPHYKLDATYSARFSAEDFGVTVDCKERDVSEIDSLLREHGATEVSLVEP